MKKLIIFSSYFVILYLLCIYPSIPIKGGVDCLAGCVIGTGFPLPNRTYHRGGFATSKPNPPEIHLNGMIIDWLFVVFTALLLTFATYKATKRLNNFLSRLIMAFIVIALIAGVFGVLKFHGVFDKFMNQSESLELNRVIVGVKTEPEWRAGTQDMTEEEESAQRAAIITAVDQVVQDVGLSEDSVTRFKYIPHFATSVDDKTLERLKTHPLVTSIEKDRLLSPY